MKKVYLAGPEVFLPEAAEIGARKKAICADRGLEGLFPLDNLLPEELAGAPPATVAERIFRANCALMRQADAIVANLTPFRGVSADVGTVFELGMMFGLGGRPLYAYSNCRDPYVDRVAREFGLVGERDRDGLLVENFGLADNLMIEGAVAPAGGRLIIGHVPPDRQLRDLAAFERCVAELAAALDDREARER